MKVARVNDRPFATLDSLLGIGASIPPIVFPDSPSTVLQLINKSGGDVDAGDVVVINPSDDVSFTTTTNAREEISVGIAQDTIVADASGPILVEGYATVVNVQASVTRGDFLETYTVAKQADGNATRHSGSFGQFLTGGTTPLAWLWGSTDASASGTITVGDGGTPVTGVDTVIFTGATVTDDTGGQVTVTVTGAGALVLLEHHTASTSSSLDFTTFISSTYDTYKIEVVNLVPATNTASLLIEAGTGGGPSYDTGNNYEWQADGTTNGSAYQTSGLTGLPPLFVAMANNAAFGFGVASLTLFDPQNTSLRRTMVGSIYYVTTTGGPAARQAHWGWQYTATGSALTALRFIMSSGNITSGTIRIYGLINS